jgi:hypothetical protein
MRETVSETVRVTQWERHERDSERDGEGDTVGGGRAQYLAQPDECARGHAVEHHLERELTEHIHPGHQLRGRLDSPIVCANRLGLVPNVEG